MQIKVDEANRVYDSRFNCNAIIHTASNTMIAGCNTTIIPSSVTSLGNGCFRGSSLKYITIPSSVTSLGELCFYDCSSLSYVTIPSSVNSIGRRCFGRCHSLKNVICNIPKAIKGDFFDSYSAYLYVPEQSLSSYKSTEPWCRFRAINPNGPMEYKVSPDTKQAEITSLNNSEMAEVFIPEIVEVDGKTYTVTNIADEAFKGKECVETVILPRSLEYIGNSAFAGCKSLSSVTVSDAEIKCKAVTASYGMVKRTAANGLDSGMRIGEYAFADCPVLNSVIIPANVTSIGDNVFDGCVKLQDVKCEAVSCPMIKEFGDFPISSATLTVPDGSVSLYRTTNPWSLFGTVKGFNGTTDIRVPNATEQNAIVGFYGIDGKNRGSVIRGLNIIRLSNGKTKKVMVK